VNEHGNTNAKMKKKPKRSKSETVFKVLSPQKNVGCYPTPLTTVFRNFPDLR